MAKYKTDYHKIIKAEGTKKGINVSKETIRFIDSLAYKKFQDLNTAQVNIKKDNVVLSADLYDGQSKVRICVDRTHIEEITFVGEIPLFSDKKKKLVRKRIPNGTFSNTMALQMTVSENGELVLTGKLFPASDKKDYAKSAALYLDRFLAEINSSLYAINQMPAGKTMKERALAVGRAIESIS